ncbi:MAG TPA: helix-turn-helix domain-containing protein [Solirubrobacterales bacterium]
MGASSKGAEQSRTTTKGKGRGKGGRSSETAQKAEEATAEIIDRRLTKALAHPLRVQILAVANQRKISPSEYAEEFEYPLATVSYHFRKLAEYDCIELVEEKKIRGTYAHFYKGSRRGLVNDADWRQLGKAIQAGVSTAALQDFIGRSVQALMAGTFDARDDSHFSWIAILLDELGWSEFTEAMRQLLERVVEIEVAACKRLRENGEPGIPATFALAGFESPREKEGGRR